MNKCSDMKLLFLLVLFYPGAMPVKSEESMQATRPRPTYADYQMELLTNMQAAVEGDPCAQVAIGNYYFKKAQALRHHVATDTEAATQDLDFMPIALEAFKWYTLAFNQGNIEAPYRMYKLMFFITEPQRSGGIRFKAVRLLRQSADMGYFDAQYDLGEAYMSLFLRYQNQDTISVDSLEYNLHIIDAAHREEYRVLALRYLKGALAHPKAKEYSSLIDAIDMLSRD